MASFEVLVVGGGGGGGSGTGAGGGGAGGVAYNASLSRTEGAYAVTVGNGGAGAPYSGGTAVGSNGEASSALGITATGGGGGSCEVGDPGTGGSGGGGAYNDAGGGAGTYGEGNNGGAGNNASPYPGGGGGGYGAVGGSGSGTVAGSGGAGYTSSISGVSTDYAGGGGGGVRSGGTAGSGVYGGGNGGVSAAGSNATANTGGGGGGAGTDNFAGGNGGSGIVIIKYLTSSVRTATGGTITTSGLYTIHTFTSTGTFTFSEPLPARFRVRDFGTALSFGGSALISVTNPSVLDFTSQFTLSCWFKTSVVASTAGGELYLMAKALPAGGTYKYALFAGNANRLSFALYNGSSNPRVDDTTSIERGTYTFVTVTYDGVNIKLYKNGAFIAKTATTISLPTGTSNFEIGQRAGASDRNFKGVIDEPRAWNRALTATEISDLYYNGLARGSVMSTGLVGEWLFDEGSGSTAYDTSGNGNHGTITGATYTTDVVMDARGVATNRLVTTPESIASMRFNGTSTLVNCGADFIGTGAFSGGGWVYAARVGEGSAGRIFDNGGLVLRRFDEQFQFSSDAGSTYALSASRVTLAQWYHVFVVRDASGNTQFYINGLPSGSPSSSGTPVAATTNLIIGNNSGSGRTWNGNLYKIQFFDRELTAQEVKSIYDNSGALPSGMLAEYYLDQRYTNISTAFDTSGNGRNATVTGAASPPFDGNLPASPRQYVNGNLLKNGDFKYQPPFVAATTTSTRWVDGTAGGSTTNNSFGWWMWVIAGTGSAQFVPQSTTDRSSIKLSTTDTLGRVQTRTAPSNTDPLASSATPFLIPIQPNTEYTFSGFIKTSNAATNSVYAYFRELNGVRAKIVDNASPKFSGTNDWTYFEQRFTTSSTARNAMISLLIDVAGNVSDAWFADIKLIPTTPEARQTA